MTYKQSFEVFILADMSAFFCKVENFCLLNIGF